MAGLAAAGAVAFSDDGRPVSDDAIMRRAFEAAAAVDRLIIDHCEDKALAGNGIEVSGGDLDGRSLEFGDWNDDGTVGYRAGQQDHPQNRDTGQQHCVSYTNNRSKYFSCASFGSQYPFEPAEAPGFFRGGYG